MSDQSTDIDVKLCRTCKKPRKYPEEFDHDPTYKEGHHVSRCKYCRAVKQFFYRHKGRVEDSQEEFELALAAMEAGTCHLCGASGGKRALIFDISALSNKFRGLLCSMCWERVKDYDGLDEKRLKALARDKNPHLAKIPKYLLYR